MLARVCDRVCDEVRNYLKQAVGIGEHIQAGHHVDAGLASREQQSAQERLAQDELELDRSKRQRTQASGCAERGRRQND